MVYKVKRIKTGKTLKGAFGRGLFSIDKEGDIYVVRFFDGRGMSSLTKTKSKSFAEKRKRKFERDFTEGILLKPDKSVYKF